jgi:hypothetical protein
VILLADTELTIVTTTGLGDSPRDAEP